MYPVSKRVEDFQMTFVFSFSYLPFWILSPKDLFLKMGSNVLEASPLSELGTLLLLPFLLCVVLKQKIPFIYENTFILPNSDDWRMWQIRTWLEQ